MSNANPGGEDLSDLEKKIKNQSFRVKRILLELPNYSYFHSVANKDEDDMNDRFVGRKAIIDRIKSFIHETSKNTGTYLVTGFRGMGKTSVVNKAISSLNSRPRFTNYFYLWLSLMPLVIYYDNAYMVINSHVSENLLIPIWTIIVTMLLAFYILISWYFGHKNPIEKGTNFIKKLKIGIIAIFNPKFDKHKFKFHRHLRQLAVFSFISFFLLITFSIHHDDITNHYYKHKFFWYVTKFVVILYFLIDGYIEYVKYIQHKYRKFERIRNHKIGALSAVLIFLSVYMGLCLLDEQRFSFGVDIAFNLLLIFLYIGIKYHYKKKDIQASGNKYSTVLGRVISFFDLQHYITVKVNLGKDKLTEKDVLKYLTNELLNEYKGWYYNIKKFKRFANVFILGITLFVLSTMIFNTFLGNEFYSFTLTKLNMGSFFPSQALEQDFDLGVLYKNSENRNTNKLDRYIEIISRESRYKEIKIGYKSLVVRRDTTVLEKIDLVPERQDVVLLSKDSINLSTNKNSNLKNSNQDDREIVSYVKEFQISEQSFLNKLEVAIATLTNEADFLFLKVWHKVRMVLLYNKDLSSIPAFKKITDKFYPKVPNLSIFVIVLMFIGLFRYIPSRFVWLKTHYYTIRELRVLKKQIDASIEIERGGSANGSTAAFFSYARRTSYKPLEAKDITQRLIHILNEVSNLNPIFVNLRFVFVFDELDKISTHFNSSIANIEDEFDIETTEVRYQVRRQERIGRILSSMKHFLNSAKAKFIFIAGREMYDAALAGISDRESSLDSIFNDNKIYVNSFYKENVDNNLADITSITEQYLFQFLIPEYYKIIKAGNPSLKMYNDYLKEVVKISDEKRIKVIITLKDFVVFLTYRCNGAPRKLSNLLEQYIMPVSDKDIVAVRDKDGKSNEAKIMRIVVGSNNENPFLKIGYYNQYKFSLISYLTSPIFLGIGNYMHEYSDKLLVSISYMLDHLFKHHKFGISYRNLSLTPEIVDINKEPQFREFLDKLIGLLAKSHLHFIVSGIYDYKFNGKIASEIKLLSKIDEHEAAAFNFTLDESIELKRHFNRRLESLRTKSESVVINKLVDIPEDYVNNISLLHMMIGDLHFYDEEFQEAIVHYLDAIQVMRQRDYKDMPLYDFVLYVRNKLKLGLAFEKNKMYDNALMIFSELTDLIIRKRNISLRKIGLARFIINSNELEKFFTDSRDDSKIENFDKDDFNYKKVKEQIDSSPTNEVIVAGRLKRNVVKEFSNHNDKDSSLWTQLYGIEDMATYYGLDNTDLINNKLEDISTNYKEIKHYFLLSTGESVRLLYQPLVAKLHLIEKTSPDKLKDIDLLRAIKEFNFLKAPLNTEAKRVIVAEFYNKVGDLLYFKNGTLNFSIKYSLTDIIDETANDDKKIRACRKLLMSPIDACLFYIKSLSVLLISKLDSDKNKIESTIDFLKYYRIRDISKGDIGEELKEFFKVVRERNLNEILIKVEKVCSSKSFKQRYSSEYLASVANGLADMAGVLLSFNGKWTIFGKPQEVQNYIYKQLQVEIWEILNLYHHAADIYSSIGENRLARSQMLKVYYLLNNCTPNTIRTLVNNKEKVFFIKGDYNLEKLKQKCIRLSKATYNQSSYVEKLKLRDIFEGEAIDDDMLHNYTSVVGSDIEEVESLHHLFFAKLLTFKKRKYYTIKVLTGFESQENLKFISGLKGKIADYISEKLNPHSIVQRKNNRILNLQLLLITNKQTITHAVKYEVTMERHLLEYTILNSIGACNELLKAYNLFGINYVTTNHMDLGKAHHRMGYWCGIYNTYKKTLDIQQQQKLDRIMKRNILNSESVNYLNKEYHYNLAIDYNNEMIDFHTRGSALQEFKKPVSFLDDFYNDNTIHFSIAVERNNLLRKKKLDSMIDRLKKNLEKEHKIPLLK